MLFPVWGTFAEQKWVTLGERRRPRTADVTARSQRGRETPSRRGAWLAGAWLWRDWLAVLGARGASAVEKHHRGGGRGWLARGCGATGWRSLAHGALWCGRIQHGL